MGAHYPKEGAHYPLPLFLFRALLKLETSFDVKEGNSLLVTCS